MRNETLIAARKLSCKTQAQVAERIGFTEVAYQRYEHGTREPKVTTAIRIAKALGTTVEELWGHEVPAQPL